MRTIRLLVLLFAPASSVVFGQMPLTTSFAQSSLFRSSFYERGSSNSAPSRARSQISAYPPVRQGVRAPTFTYASSAQSRKTAVAGFLERTSLRNPEAGKAYAAELQKSDVFAFYSKLIAGTAYRSNDAADAFAAYIALGYIIVNGGNTSHAQESALRTQVALRASSNPSFTPANRTQLAEELKIMTVVMHGGFQAAEREGKQRDYADGIARLFASNGIDLRALRLTDQGLVAR